MGHLNFEYINKRFDCTEGVNTFLEKGKGAVTYIPCLGKQTRLPFSNIGITLEQYRRYVKFTYSK